MIHKNNPHYTELYTQEIQELLNQHKSYTIVAQLMLWESKPFSQYCRTHKLVLPENTVHSYLVKYTNEELKDLYQQSNSYTKLAKFLGPPCTRASLINEFRKRGILGLHDWISPGIDLGKSNKGKILSQDEKNKRRQGALNWEGHQSHMKKLLSIHTGSKRSEKTKQKMAIASTKRKPFKGQSSLEKKYKEGLQWANISFIEQYPIPEVRSIVDFFVRPNICVFVDGCFVHACREHYPELYDSTYRQGKKRLENAYTRSTQNDPNVTKNLQNLGYKVLRFWEHEINTDLPSCVSKIEQALTSDNQL